MADVLLINMNIKFSSEIRLNPKLKALFKIIMIGFIIFLVWLIVDLIGYLLLPTFLH